MLRACVGLLFLSVACIVQGQDQNEGNPLCADLNDGNGILPEYGDNCRLYVVCIGYNAYQRPCAAGTAYNTFDQFCSDMLEDVNCDAVQTSGIQFDCAPRVAQANCSQFFECDLDDEVPKSCGEGTIYDERSLVCAWPTDEVLSRQNCVYNS